MTPPRRTARPAARTGPGPSRPVGRSFDLLRAPIVGPFLRWRHARTVLQSLALGLAVLILLDGWFGPQQAPRNLAGVVPWVHWRGFIVLALLIAGNLFCMACPFMLPRRIAKRILPADREWPAPLRSKWLAVGLLALFFWAYEAFSLWSSPWLTAWVAGAYFASAFVVDGFFRGASFCRFVCPIGQFHFVNSMVSPTEVRVRDPAICERCATLDCIRGRYDPSVIGSVEPVRDASGSDTDRANPWESRPLQPDDGGLLAMATAGGGSVGSAGRALGSRGLIQQGCELALYQPRKEGNLDCTFCMECIHACPHDNVGIFTRSPLRDLTADPVRSGVGRISRRPDMAALALLLTFAAFVNAFGMVEPVFALQEWMARTLGVTSRAPLILVFSAIGLVVLPAVVTGATAAASRALSPAGDTVIERASRYAWGLVPLGFGMWIAHYLYHLLIGGFTLIPVAQQYLRELGLPAGSPAWGLGPMVPEHWLLPIELLALQGGLFVTLIALHRISRSERQEHRTHRRSAVRAFLPWAVLATLLTGAGIWLLLQPMQMRGTFLVGS